jgi:hypothetical protein
MGIFAVNEILVSFGRIFEVKLTEVAETGRLSSYSPTAAGLRADARSIRDGAGDDRSEKNSSFAFLPPIFDCAVSNLLFLRGNLGGGSDGSAIGLARKPKCRQIAPHKWRPLVGLFVHGGYPGRGRCCGYLVSSLIKSACNPQIISRKNRWPARFHPANPYDPQCDQ